jgi:hypothetical protein
MAASPSRLMWRKGGLKTGENQANALLQRTVSKCEIDD